MKRRILIYGGTELSAAEASFVEALTYALLEKGDTAVITGGFIASKKAPKAVSTDISILKGASKYAFQQNKPLSECLETWLPDIMAETDPAKKEVERFEQGLVKLLQGVSSQARRFLMVRDIDVVLTIKGKKHTASILDFALSINKPALPLPFTNGDSINYWNKNRNRIQQWFDIDDAFATKLETTQLENIFTPDKEQLLKHIVHCVNKGIDKEKHNNQQYKDQQQQWIEDHRTIPDRHIATIANPEIKSDTYTKPPPNVFLSYAKEDESLKEQLDKHLTALKRSNKISLWNDEEILAGENWNEIIIERLRVADMILLLVSSDFLDSEYIWKIELDYAIKKQKEGLLLVIPIFLRACDIEGMPFENLKGYPQKNTPITSFPKEERDEVFLQVVSGIRKEVNAWQSTNTRHPGHNQGT